MRTLCGLLVFGFLLPEPISAARLFLRDQELLFCFDVQAKKVLATCRARSRIQSRDVLAAADRIRAI